MAINSADIMNQLTAKLSKLERKYWNILLAVFLLFVVLLDYLFLLKPQIGTLSKLNPEIKVLSDNMKRTKSDIERIAQYKDQVQALKKNVEELKLRVRSKQESSFIIEKISRIAHKHNVKIDQIMPNFLKQEVTLASEDRTYYDLPIMIEARSAYHDFGRFINDLEKEETFLEVRGLTVAAMPGTQLNAVKLTLNTIVYEEN